jgi:hypothetical protein
MMLLSKKMQEKIVFATWCNVNNTKPYDLAILLLLAKKAFRLNEAEINSPGFVKKAEKARRAFETKALECGFESAWHRLYPSLVKDGIDIQLPWHD